MGTVVRFPHATRRSRAAASPAILSAVKPAFRAVEVARIGNHHSAGILSRVHHLRAAKIEAPISPASESAAGLGQSDTTSRKLVSDEAMELLIRPAVLKSKPILSRDLALPAGNNRLMSGQTQYRDNFAQRVFSAREHAGLTQDEIAHVLKTSQPTYNKYETRSLMPLWHLWAFCLACRVSVEWLVTGQGKGGVTLLTRPAPRQRPGRKRRRIVA